MLHNVEETVWLKVKNKLMPSTYLVVQSGDLMDTESVILCPESLIASSWVFACVNLIRSRLDFKDIRQHNICAGMYIKCIYVSK